MMTTDLATLTTRLDRLEAETAIRGVMARYMAICDRLDQSTDLTALGEMFTADAVWEGKGARYAAAFGVLQGREAIVDMIGNYCTAPPHFAMNAHFLTSESITAESDVGTGRWMMLQTSTYADGTSDLRSAQLSVGFARDDGRWRIARFETENLFGRAIDRWDDAAATIVPEESR